MHRFHHWRVRIQDAHSERAIVGVLDEYLSMLSPEMVESLPAACREALRSPDLAQAALTLLHCEITFTGPPEVTAILHEVAHTYAAASVRLASLKRPAAFPEVKPV